jgi:Holliday junction DNA helicase RuvA
MISSVQGRVAAVSADTAVIEVGGVGLAVQCTPTTAGSLRVGQSTQLATSLVVREDSLTLYGFADDDERQVFDLVQTVSGVGPRIAQAVLAVHSPGAFRAIVATEDLAALSTVPGIGRKGAQRIVLELKDKLGPVGDLGHRGTGLPGRPQWQADVHAALIALGWNVKEADDAVTQVAAEVARGEAGIDAADTSSLLRAALRLLGPR